MADCLIVTTLVSEFAAEVDRLCDGEIQTKACSSIEQALADYTGETILFGNPDMIAGLLPFMPAVSWVQSSWAGVTPLIQHERRNYTLTGIKDVFGPQMSEYVIGYLLAHELKVHARRKKQADRQWFDVRSGTLSGKRIGIMGTGSIGRHIAATSRQFGMCPTGLSRTATPKKEFDKVLPVSELHEFLGQVDYLVSTLPQTPATDRLLDRESLSFLTKEAYFVNVGRSNVVDDAALIEALNRQQIAGAALDVFDHEPLPAKSPLWNTPNLSISAHIAAVSHPLLIVPVFVDNYRRFAQGRPLQYIVDFDAGY